MRRNCTADVNSLLATDSDYNEHLPGDMTTEKDISGWTGVPQATRKIKITAADVRAIAVALAAAAFAIGVSRFTWPMLQHTPFILLFSSVFVASKFGSDSAGLLTLTLTALSAPYIAPPEARPAFQDSSLIVFILGAFAGNRIIGSQARMEKRLADSEA